jgi:hypothetical protein
VGRRAAMHHAAHLWLLGSSSLALGLGASQISRAGSTADLAGTEWQDPLGDELRSATGTAARLERAALEHEWQALREARDSGLIDRAATENALATVLQVRNAILRAEALARDRRTVEIEPIITKSLVRDFERASTMLASSPLLSHDARDSIGWQWGACGFKRCGAQADAAQALSKLRANLGMVVPLEALFYLDIAKRAVEEILQIGVNAGCLPAGAIGPAPEYLSRETLEMILPAEDVATGDANLPVQKGGSTEAEDALDQYEATMLEELERSLAADESSGS